MKKFEITNLIIFTFFYGVFSLFMYLILTLSGLSIWMGINVGFAMIPLVIIVFLYQRFLDNDMKIDLVLIIGLVIYILFYPNAFYILTDFIHIDSLDFYTHELTNGYPAHYETVYRLIIDPYFMLFHIIISAIIGVYAGIQSLLYLEKMINLKFNNKKLTTLVVIIMLFLSSTGIYLGRFLRFFSFDILRPIYLLKTFFFSIDLFTFSFIIFFTGLEVLIYYGYKFLMIKIPND